MLEKCTLHPVFVWHGQAQAQGETPGQQKRRLVQEALFQELYGDA